MQKKSTYVLQLRIFLLRLFSGFLLSFESLSRALWRPVILLGFFASLWLLRVPALFGNIGEIIAFLGFIVGMAYLLWKDARVFRLPSMHDIERRIEADSGIKNRPLSSARDRLANPQDRGTRRLWHIAQARLLSLLPKLKAAKTHPFLAEKDPYALRFAVLMLFVLGMMVAGPDWRGRVQDGLTPFHFGSDQAQKHERFTLWITPPAYTALPQLVLNQNTIKDESIRIARDSSIKAIVNGGFGTPRLSTGEIQHDFESSADNSHAIEVIAPTENGVLKLSQGLFPLASWPYEIIDDNPPGISVIADKPEALDNGELRFGLSVNDDYGVEYLNMTMTLDDVVEDAPIGEAISEQRSIISPAKQDFDIAPVYDLTSHTWAGLPVVFDFVASDKAGQDSIPVQVKVILPERNFEHPVAKTLIALRKKLAWQPEAISAYNEIHHDLQILLTAEELFHNDPVVYLGIRSATSRLRYNEPSLETSQSIMALMWDIALRVEDGDLSLTARRLRDAQMALEEALKNPNVSDEEIARLMQDLRNAMADYFTELAREMQKKSMSGQEFSMMPPEMMNHMMDPNALADFLDQMESEMRSGNKDSAQQMLSQMQRLLDMMNPSMSGQMPADMQMMQEGVNELEELIERQEALLEQTQGQAKILYMLGGLGLDYGQSLPRDLDLLKEWDLEELPPQPGTPKPSPKVAPPFVNTQENRSEQEALRIILGQLMLDANEIIGNVPDSMGKAEQEMRGSSEALGLNDPVKSVPHQERAIEYLKESQQEMAQQLQQRMQQMTGFMIGSSGMQYDPFGRPYGGQDDPNGRGHGSQIQIPDEAERRRVQEILQLLRRRAGELNRPREELEYYRRLLKRF